MQVSDKSTTLVGCKAQLRKFFSNRNPIEEESEWSRLLAGDDLTMGMEYDICIVEYLIDKLRKERRFGK